MGKLNLGSPKVKLFILLLVLVPISIFVAKTDFSEVGNALRSIGWRFLLLLSVTCIAYLFGTLSWHVCLGPYRKNVSTFRLFAIRQVGETVGLYNPTSIVGGDLLKSEFLKRYHIPSSITVSSVITARLTAILSQLSLFMLAIIWLLMSEYGNSILAFTGGYAYLFLALTVLLKLSFIYWLLKPNNGQVKLLNNTSWLNKRLQSVTKTIETLKNNIQTNIRAFWTSYIYSAIHWIIGSLEFYLILKFLGYNVSIMSGLLLDMSVIVIKSFAAFVPGQLGVEEIGNKVMLAAIGISGGMTWITVSILRRARQLAWIVFGFILLWFIKKDLHHART